LRFFELQAWRGVNEDGHIPTDRVRVVIPQATVDAFFRKVEGIEGYKGKEGRRRFNLLPQEAKLARIVADGGEEYVDRVEIKSDPEVFMTFKNKVMPILITNCSTSTCHGKPGGDRTGFRIFDEATRPPESVYTNFLQLDEYESGRYHMIDRAHPNE